MKAIEIAEKVSSGEISARSVVEQHIEIINDIEPDVNAFNLVTAEKALIDADEIDSTHNSGVDSTHNENADSTLKDIEDAVEALRVL